MPVRSPGNPGGAPRERVMSISSKLAIVVLPAMLLVAACGQTQG